MNKSSKIYVAGRYGMLGIAIEAYLRDNGYTNIIGLSSKQLDLTNQDSVNNFFVDNKPEYVFLCAAKVGGIQANISLAGQMVYENLMIQNNVIHASLIHQTKRLIFVSSGCVYPKLSVNPIKEESLLTAALESSNAHYAIAKIAGIKLCEAYHQQYGFSYAVVVPCNIYGLHDNFHKENSHIMAALIRKFHESKNSETKEVEIWGSGNQRREFVFVDDVAEMCVALMQTDTVQAMVNCGFGSDVSVKELCQIISEIVCPNGDVKLVFNTQRPEGHFQKLFDVTKAQNLLKWQAKTTLQQGIAQVYNWFINNQQEVRS
jgi:GDP-L-fucose synthase